MRPASRRRGPRRAPCVDGVADGGEELELAAAVAGSGDAGGEQRGAELDAGVVGVHLPEAGEEGFAFGVDDAGSGREERRRLRAGGRRCGRRG